jgi:hypothetical protein
MAGTTVLRQTLKLGAGCGNSACPDLSGGRGVTLVPTGIYKANRKIGGDAPSVYLPRIQAEKNVQLSDMQMNNLLESHAIDPTLLRADNFEKFAADRRRRLGELVSKAMGKPVNLVSENDEYIDNSLTEESEELRLF